MSSWDIAGSGVAGSSGAAVCSLPIVGRPFAGAGFVTVPAGMAESVALGMGEVMALGAGDGELSSSLEHASAKHRHASDRERKKSILMGTTAPLISRAVPD
jgi:hypothetical protein